MVLEEPFRFVLELLRLMIGRHTLEKVVINDRVA
jgi:hypothetical protein